MVDKNELIVKEIDLYHCIKGVWGNKLKILMIFSAFVFMAVIYCVITPRSYKASLVVVPNSERSSSLSAISGSLGGLAGLAGFNIGSGGDTTKIIALETLKSWAFIERIVDKYELSDEIYAVKKWDPKENKLIYNNRLYDGATNKWKKDFDDVRIGNQRPSSWILYESFMNKLKISEDRSTGLITISFLHLSPELAKNICDILLNEINQHIREKDILEAKKSIVFLNQEIENTSVSEMQTVLYQLIEEQTKKLMLASTSHDYVFKVVSEAKIPEEQSGVSPYLFILIFGFLGLALSSSYYFLLFAIRQ